MHGVKKNEESPLFATSSEEIEKIKKYKDLCAKVREMKAGILPMDLEIIKKAILLNVDWITAWNLLKSALDSCAWEAEELLAFSVAAIKCNPKSYPCWNNRRQLVTILSQKYSMAPIKHHASSPPSQLSQLITRELALVRKLFEVDDRNFHCWNYRKWLVARFPEMIDLQAEIDYSTLLVYKNFSNYSAWHHRSIILQNIRSKESVAKMQEMINNDLFLLKNAYFTEPFDQSTWWYLRWILEWAEEELIFESTEWNALIISECKSIVDLLEIEGDCALAASSLYHLQQMAGKVFVEKDVLERLQRIDPLRSKMYQDAFK